MLFCISVFGERAKKNNAGGYAKISLMEQAQLLDLETREFDPFWVDPNQPLQVPINPLHFAAHKYQIILARLERQAAKNPAQFNSGNYILIMEKLEKLWEAINDGKTSKALDEGNVAGVGDARGARANSNVKPISLDP